MRLSQWARAEGWTVEGCKTELEDLARTVDRALKTEEFETMDGGRFAVVSSEGPDAPHLRRDSTSDKDDLILEKNLKTARGVLQGLYGQQSRNFIGLTLDHGLRLYSSVEGRPDFLGDSLLHSVSALSSLREYRASLLETSITIQVAEAFSTIIDVIAEKDSSISLLASEVRTKALGLAISIKNLMGK